MGRLLRATANVFAEAVLERDRLSSKRSASAIYLSGDADLSHHCLAATVLNELGVIRLVTLLVSPVLSLFGAPEDAAPGLVFSLIRKDGILLFNEGNGALLDMLPGATLFLLIYLASTFTPCMVTVWTIAKELGMKTAAAIMGKQMATSVVSVLIIMIILKLTLCIFK